MEPGSPSKSIAAVVARLATWAAHAPKGLARVEYDSGHARDRAVAELRTALAEKNVPAHVLVLPQAQEPAATVRHLVARLRSLPPRGLVAIVGWATAFAREVPLVDALRLLNANRENLARFELCQVWWLTRSFADALRHTAPDLDSWFTLRLDLAAVPTPPRASVGAASGALVGGPFGAAIGAGVAGYLGRPHHENADGTKADDLARTTPWPLGTDPLWTPLADTRTIGRESAARTRAQSILERFDLALRGSAPFDDLRELAWRALAILHLASLADEADQAAAHLNAAARAVGHPVVVPPPIGATAPQDVSRPGHAHGTPRHPAEVQQRLQQLEVASPPAARLVHLAALLAPLPVPEELLFLGASGFAGELGSAMAAEEGRKRMLLLAERCAVLQVDAGAQTFCIPPPVRSVIRENPTAALSRVPPEQEALNAVTRAIGTQALAIPVLRQRVWPHVEACVSLAPSAGLEATLDLARPLALRGAGLRAAGHASEAVQWISVAVGLFRTLAAERPAAFLLDLAVHVGELAQSLRALRRHDEAVAARHEAVQIWRRVNDEQGAAEVPYLATALYDSSQDLAAANRHAEALAAAEEAVHIWRRHVAQQPRYLPALAKGRENMAFNLSQLGRDDEAAQALEDSVGHYRIAVGQGADRHVRCNFGAALERYGHILAKSAREPDAIEALREAVAVTMSLVEAREESVTVLGARVLALDALLAKAGPQPEAEDTLRRARDLHDALAGKR